MVRRALFEPVSNHAHAHNRVLMPCHEAVKIEA
jgi:hypothetical protein